MPLLEHFRPPMRHDSFWTSFHGTWAVYLAGCLNKLLPPDYVAQPTARFDIEIDVAALKRPHAVEEARWYPPPATGSTEFAVAGDEIEVPVYFQLDDSRLVGAIELVSPTNKSGPGQRKAFINKCIGMLSDGVGVTIVDIVTNRLANLHEELLARVSGDAVRSGLATYAASYRPVVRDDATWLDHWYQPLTLGAVLPTVPLWLGNNLCLPVELEAAYVSSCELLRVDLAPPGQMG